MVVSLRFGGGHGPGSGPLPAGLPITVDVWSRDDASGCWADMTRTFVNGEVTAEVAALRDTGFPTQRTRTPGETLVTGDAVGTRDHEPDEVAAGPAGAVSFDQLPSSPLVSRARSMRRPGIRIRPRRATRLYG